MYLLLCILLRAYGVLCENTMQGAFSAPPNPWQREWPKSITAQELQAFATDGIIKVASRTEQEFFLVFALPLSRRLLLRNRTRYYRPATPSTPLLPDIDDEREGGDSHRVFEALFPPLNDSIIDRRDAIKAVTTDAVAVYTSTEQQGRLLDALPDLISMDHVVIECDLYYYENLLETTFMKHRHSKYIVESIWNTITFFESSLKGANNSVVNYSATPASYFRLTQAVVRLSPPLHPPQQLPLRTDSLLKNEKENKFHSGKLIQYLLVRIGLPAVRRSSITIYVLFKEDVLAPLFPGLTLSPTSTNLYPKNSIAYWKAHWKARQKVAFRAWILQQQAPSGANVLANDSEKINSSTATVHTKVTDSFLTEDFIPQIAYFRSQAIDASFSLFVLPGAAYILHLTLWTSFCVVFAMSWLLVSHSNYRWASEEKALTRRDRKKLNLLMMVTRGRIFQTNWRGEKDFYAEWRVLPSANISEPVFKVYYGFDKFAPLVLATRYHIKVYFKNRQPHIVVTSHIPKTLERAVTTDQLRASFQDLKNLNSCREKWRRLEGAGGAFFVALIVGQMDPVRQTIVAKGRSQLAGFPTDDLGGGLHTLWLPLITVFWFFGSLLVIVPLTRKHLLRISQNFFTTLAALRSEGTLEERGSHNKSSVERDPFEPPSSQDAEVIRKPWSRSRGWRDFVNLKETWKRAPRRKSKKYRKIPLYSENDDEDEGVNENENEDANQDKNEGGNQDEDKGDNENQDHKEHTDEPDELQWGADRKWKKSSSRHHYPYLPRDG